MNWFTVLGSSTTVLSFLLFLGIVCWAWSARRTTAFAEAAAAPFALPDEPASAEAGSAERQS